MRNLNKMVLQAPDNFLITPISTGTPIVLFDDIDHVANDLGRPVDIVAIQISALIIPRVDPSGATFYFEISLGTQNTSDKNTNIFNWVLPFSVSYAPKENAINQVIGDFKTPLFTMKAFTSGLSGGMAQFGQIFLNGVLKNQVSAVSQTMELHCYITLYYK